jgi:septum formation inhibitor-activating ATPase MinD
MILGHYGSGKTNIALNLAAEYKKTRERVAIADLDIVNPYFRTKDSLDFLEEQGIRLIVSEYANTNIDIPALPQDMYAVTDDKGLTCVLDIGGDDRGALVLGRLRPEILRENDYENLLVINRYRPLTADAASTVEVMREIEEASGIPFTGIINNSNIGVETTAEAVLASLPYAEEVSKLTGLPIRMTTVRDDIAKGLAGKVEGLFPLTLQKNFIERKIQ